MAEYRAGAPFFSATADADVTVVGKIVLLRPLTGRAAAWIAKHAPQKLECCCGALRMSITGLEDIVTGLRNDGMTVA